MVTEVRRQLDAKIKTKPSAPVVTKGLWPSEDELKKAEMLSETKETVDALRAAGIRSTVVVEAEM